jgi:ribosomal-protein-alanine N-acetyltransferase
MLIHKGTQTIETQRLILRCFKPEDAPAMYRNWASDPQVTKYLRWPAHSSEAVSAYVVQDWINNYRKPDFYQWAIILKENGSEPIGSIGGFDGNDQIGKIEIGYCMGRKWWGSGIMTEALGAAMWYLFDIVGYNRIQACHDADNPASGAVMRKCGMRCEGIFRQAGANNQGICDLVYYAMLSSDRK